MQFISTLQKYLIIVVLSCSLLITWNVGVFEVIPLKPTRFNEPSIASSAEPIWDSLSREFKIDHRAQTAPVQAEIRKLLADQDELRRILRAAGPYLYFIYQQTQARGLPAELALIPVIESEFNPYDHSKKGATGLWQLMPGTAHELGVQVKSGYDGRRNVIASTKAALAYFNDLGKYFHGNWYLAIAAYNCGQGKVDRAKKRNGSSNFWHLHLPKETQYYVPKLLAVAEIVQNPDKYGVELPPIKNEPYFAEVKIDKPVNIDKVAKSADVPVKTLQTLNPDHKQVISPKKGVTTMLVPIKKAAVVKAAI